MTTTSTLHSTLTVGLEDRSYPIYIGDGLIDSAELLTKHLPQKRVAVVSNTIVAQHYLHRLRAAFDRAGVAMVTIILPDGEDHKNWHSLNLIFDRLLATRCERQTSVIALGGGVVGLFHLLHKGL